MDNLILALETSSSVCDIALLIGGASGVRVASLSHNTPGEHAERVFPMIDQLLAQANINRSQLDAIAFGQGPGGFTGLRIACGVAQGIGFGLGIPVIAVPSLHAIARRAHYSIYAGNAAANGAIHIVLQDARMSEVYAAVYVAKAAAGKLLWHELHSPVLISAAQAGQWLSHNAAAWGVSAKLPAFVSGSALSAYPQLMQGVSSPHISEGGTWEADASSLAHIALELYLNKQTIDPASAMPLYVREKVAFTIKEREQGAGGNPKASNIL